MNSQQAGEPPRIGPAGPGEGVLDGRAKRDLLIIFRPAIHGFARRQLGRFGLRVRREDEDEVVQETMRRALSSRAPVLRGQFRAWLFGHSRNATRAWRQQQETGLIGGLADPNAIPDQLDLDPSPDEALERAEALQMMHVRLSKLRPSERQILQSFYIEQLTVEAISSKSGKSVMAVRSLLKRARNTLRRGAREATPDPSGGTANGMPADSPGIPRLTTAVG